MRYTILLFALLVFSGCKSLPHSGDSQPPAASAQGGKMSESFINLHALALDAAQFNNVQNHEMIMRELSTLSRFPHIGKPAAAGYSEAQRQLQIGNRGYARFLIREGNQDCLTCHAQSDRGPRFLANPSSSFFNRLNSLDKTAFLISVWSFDNGLAEYEKAMNDPAISAMPIANLEHATLRALSVAVRVRKDPALAESIVTRLMYAKWAPVSLQMNAAKWKAGIQEWKTSKRVPRSLDDAKALIGKAWTMQMQSPRSGLIESMRASSVLQDLLAQKKSGKAYAETLYYAGLNSEALKELDPFLQNESYFEACVRHVPHSETARSCYLRLESAANGDYAAFESIPMPEPAREKLASLRKLAEPTSGSWLEWGKGND